jgi:hypothetical protein
LKTQPTPPYTITVRMEPYMSTAANSESGILLRESATGKLGCVALRDPGQVSAINYSGYNSGGYINTPVNVTYPFRGIWLRIVHSGTTMSTYYSADGAIFRLLQTAALTVAFTTAPDQAGYFVDPRGQDVAASFLSWTES